MKQTDRKIVKLIEALQGNKKEQNILVAKVNSTSPITIKMYDLVVSKHIYVNSSFLKSSSSEIDANVSWDKDQDYIPTNMLSFTTKMFKGDMLSVGDTVIVLQDGVSFYVLERVSKVA